MEKAVKSGEATGQDFAYLTDRVRVGEGKKQLYGTQFQGAGDKMEPYPIEDEAGVDRRRKEVGLPTMAKYRKLLAERTSPSPRKKVTAARPPSPPRRRGRIFPGAPAPAGEERNPCLRGGLPDRRVPAARGTAHRGSSVSGRSAAPGSAEARHIWTAPGTDDGGTAVSGRR